MKLYLSNKSSFVEREIRGETKALVEDIFCFDLRSSTLKIYSFTLKKLLVYRPRNTKRQRSDKDAKFLLDLLDTLKASFFYIFKTVRVSFT